MKAFIICPQQNMWSDKVKIIRAEVRPADEVGAIIVYAKLHNNYMGDVKNESEDCKSVQCNKQHVDCKHTTR